MEVNLVGQSHVCRLWYHTLKKQQQTNKTKQKQPYSVLIAYENFPAKRFKSKKMVNRTSSRSKSILHISEQFVGFKIPDKSTVDYSFHGFTDTGCQCNTRAIVCRI